MSAKPRGMGLMRRWPLSSQEARSHQTPVLWHFNVGHGHSASLLDRENYISVV